MPHAPETCNADGKPASKAVIAEIRFLFEFPGLYQLAETVKPIMGQTGSRGRRGYPLAGLLAAAIAARSAGSLPSALNLMAEPGVWADCRAAYAEMTGSQQLPDRPPNRDQVRYLRDKISAHPHILDELERTFRRGAMAEAQALGNLSRTATRDHANPDEKNMIYGDGTVMGAYSDVVELPPNSLTGEPVILHSRAKDPARARIQRIHSNTREDGKTLVRGVNHVAMHTWTEVGRVVLGTTVALRSEMWAALDLVDSISALAEGGVHTVVYDRALTGWNVDYLMGHHGIQLVAKPVADGVAAKSATSAYKVLEQRRDRLAAEHQLRQDANIKIILDRAVLAQMWAQRAALPVGTCLYEKTSAMAFDLVLSQHFDLGLVTHSTSTGSCEHHLMVDDGALHVVETHPEEGHLVKTATARCTSSTAARGGDGRWTSTGTWRIPCDDGDFDYTRTWRPTGRRWTADVQKPANATGQDRIGEELRPVGRGDGTQFHKLFDRRNDAEAYNAWVKDRVPHHGRATSLTLEGQKLDFLFAAVVNNSNAWSRR